MAAPRLRSLNAQWAEGQLSATVKPPGLYAHEGTDGEFDKSSCAITLIEFLPEVAASLDVPRFNPRCFSLCSCNGRIRLRLSRGGRITCRSVSTRPIVSELLERNPWPCESNTPPKERELTSALRRYCRHDGRSRRRDLPRRPEDISGFLRTEIASAR